MLRKFLCLALLVCACFAGAQDLGKMLRARYEALNNAIMRRDTKAAEQWVSRYCHPDFLYTSKDKKKWDRKGFRQGLLDQMKLTKKVEHSKIKLSGYKVKANSISLTYFNDFRATVSYDSRDLTLTDESETHDTWVKVGSDWKLKGVVQTRADTQLFQKKP